jgi:hypothetical protein
MFCRDALVEKYCQNLLVANFLLRISYRISLVANLLSQTSCRKSFVTNLLSQIICRKSFVANHLSQIICRKSFVANHLSQIICRKSFVANLFVANLLVANLLSQISCRKSLVANLLSQISCRKSLVANLLFKSHDLLSWMAKCELTLEFWSTGMYAGSISAYLSPQAGLLTLMHRCFVCMTFCWSSLITRFYLADQLINSHTRRLASA